MSFYFSKFESSITDIKTSLNLNDGPYPVHRLDKVDPIFESLCQSGCLLIALTPKAAQMSVYSIS